MFQNVNDHRRASETSLCLIATVQSYKEYTRKNPAKTYYSDFAGYAG